MRMRLIHPALLVGSITLTGFTGLTGFATARASEPASYEDLNQEAVAAYDAGDYEQAIDYWERIREFAGPNPVLDASLPLYNLACSYALTGDGDGALEILASVVPRGVVSHEHLTTDPDLASLRDDPRFVEIAESARLREEADHRTYDQVAYSIDYTPFLTNEEKIAGLSKLWAEVKFGFVYFDQVPDLDWDSVYVSCIPKVIAAETTIAYYRLLSEMIALLKDGHTNIIYPSELGNEVYARPRIETDLIGDKVLITGILEDSVLELGVEVGDEIVSVDGIPVREHAEKHVAPYISSSTPQDGRIRVYDYHLLAGSVTEPVVLEIRGADAELRTVELERVPRWPSSSLDLDWKVLDGNIGYIAINTFNNKQVIEHFPRAMDAVRDTDGLVIDIRRNGGGSSGWWVMEYLGDQYRTTHWATREYRPVYRPWGRSQTWYRGGGALIHSKREWIYEKPVVLLIGPRTYSAAEDFAAVFQAENRGKLIGEPTGGSTGQPLQFRLPAGGWAGVCAKRDWMVDGRQFVGYGIQPDVVVSPTAADVRDGRDPVLQAARSELNGSGD